MTQNFLRDNTPDFISSQEWTSHSTDLNPLHYWVWDTLQELVYERRHEPFANTKNLQNVILDKQTAKIKQEIQANAHETSESL